MKKKKQASSQLLTCDICGKKVFARGLKSHVRLQHKLKLETQVVTQVIEKEYIKPKHKSGKLFTEEIKLSASENYTDPTTSMEASMRLGLKFDPVKAGLRLKSLT